MLRDLLFPPVCIGCFLALRPGDHSLPLCRTCNREQDRLPLEHRRERGIWACLPFTGPVASALVRFKLGGDLTLAGPLAAILTDSPAWNHDWDLAVPVPMHWTRRFVRGLDHTRHLLHHAARTLPRPVDVDPGCLRRTRRVPVQRELPASARAENVRGSVAVVRGHPVQGLRVLVVDDVVTTGATLKEAMRTLRAAGAQHVAALALLRAVA